MPLTPEDVSNKRFTPVRLREGYDMGEVDQFLDEVEAELERLLAENDDLRTKLAAAQGGEPPAPALRSLPRRLPRSRRRQAGRRGRRARRRRRRPGRRCRCAARDDQGGHRRRGLLGRAPAARARHQQRRRARRRGEGRGRQDRRRRPHQGRAPGGRDQGQDRAARAGGPHPRADPRLRDREQAQPALSATWSRRRPASTARSSTCAPSSASTAAG